MLRAANMPPMTFKSGFLSFIPLPKAWEMPVTIPNHPI